MSTYQVAVRNEITGEVAVIHWESDCKESAQVEVLHMLFRSRGWRKATAMVPGVVTPDWKAARQRCEERFPGGLLTKCRG